MLTLKIQALLVLAMVNVYAQTGTTIAVLGLDPAGISKTEAQVLSNRIRSIMVNSSHFRVLERANMESILIEQGFQQSGCTSDECLVEAGQLLGVQKMLAGSVGKFGAVYTIELRIIDVESGKIESSATYDYRGEMENLLLEGAPAAVTKLIQLDKQLAQKKTEVNAFLQIETNVADAVIMIDSLSAGPGKTDLLPMNPGRHQIFVQHDFYLPLKDEVILVAGDTIIQVLKLIRAEAILNLNGIPAEADYIIADQTGKSSERDRLILPAGRHRLTLFSPFYYPIEQELVLKRDSTLTYNFKLAYGGKDLESLQSRQRWLLTGSLTGAGLTIVAALLANVFYHQYQDAASSDDAAHYKNLTQTFDQTTIILSGVTLSLSAVTIWNWLKTNSLKNELHVPQ